MVIDHLNKKDILSSPALNEIHEVIQNNTVVLFMKGTIDMPMCGFSSTVVKILQLFKVDFVAVNVLEDEEVREAIKKYSSWPTIPQLYLDQEFMGGCDIIKELYESGELEIILKNYLNTAK